MVRDFYSVQDDRFDSIVHGAKSEELNDIVQSFIKVGLGDFPPLKVIHLREDKLTGINRSAVLDVRQLGALPRFSSSDQLKDPKWQMNQIRHTLAATLLP